MTYKTGKTFLVKVNPKLAFSSSKNLKEKSSIKPPMSNIFQSTDEEVNEKIKEFFSNSKVQRALLSIAITASSAIFAVNFPLTFLFSLLFLVVAGFIFFVITGISNGYL